MELGGKCAGLQPGPGGESPLKPLRRTALLIALAGALAAGAVFPFAGAYGAILAGGWIVSLLTAVTAVPPLAKKAWAQGVSDPTDPARKAFAEAAKADLLPPVRQIVDDALRPIAVKMGDLDAQRQRVEGELNALKLLVLPLKEGIEVLQPLGRTVEVEMEGGKREHRLALQLTLNSTIEALNGLIDWISAEPPNPGLAGTFEASLLRVKEHDVMAELGARGNAAQRAAAEKLGIQAADRLQYAIENPQAAQMGLQLQQTEAALGEILGMMGVKDGAIKTWAMAAAQRQMVSGALQPGQAQPGGPSGFRPM